MSLGKSSLPPPVINTEKPKPTPHVDRSTQPTRRAILRQMFKTPNARYGLLWLLGVTLFAVYGKRVIRLREEELVVNDIENYLRNKRKQE